MPDGRPDSTASRAATSRQRVASRCQPCARNVAATSTRSVESAAESSPPTAGAGLQRQGMGGDGPRGAVLFGESPGGVVGGGGGPGHVAVGELDLGRREQCSRQLGGLTLLFVHRHADLHQRVGVLEQSGVGEGLGVVGVQPGQHRVGVGPPVHRSRPA